MIKLAHISTGLGTGGAEVQLQRILTETNKDQFEMILISLDTETYLADRIRELGIPVYSLGLKQNPLRIWKGIKILREFNPDVIHGTMYEGGFFGCLFNKFFKKRPQTILTVHEGLDNYKKESLRKQLQLKFWAMISFLPTSLMYVSEVNRQQHADWGFNNKKSIVIPNGVDTERFGKFPEAKQKIRDELKLKEDDFVIGITARYHLQKNHRGFINSAALLLKKHPKVKFVLVGTDVDWDNDVLVKQIDELSIRDNVYLLGNREDIPQIVNAYDVACLSSFSEAFPLTLGEAMVSGVPCVATDVGDVKNIIGDTGIAVPVDQDEAMMLAWGKMVEMDKDAFKTLGENARQRCLDYFTLHQQVAAHEELYIQLVKSNAKCDQNLVANIDS